MKKFSVNLLFIAFLEVFLLTSLYLVLNGKNILELRAKTEDYVIELIIDSTQNRNNNEKSFQTKDIPQTLESVNCYLKKKLNSISENKL